MSIIIGICSNANYYYFYEKWLRGEITGDDELWASRYRLMISGNYVISALESLGKSSARIWIEFFESLYLILWNDF